MGETSIEWTQKTWNPTRGCSRVSPGCESCYAEKVARRFAGPGGAYEGLVRLTPGGKPKAQWNGVVRLVPEHLADPLRWRKPVRIFVDSMSDLFHEALTNEQIAAVFGVMAAAPHHTFQVLTKRPERMREWFAWVDDDSMVCPFDRVCGNAAAHVDPELWERILGELGLDQADDGICDPVWPLPNVWLGVSVEDQQRADERIPLLLETPTAVRFVSYEPALGPVDFTRIPVLDKDDGEEIDRLSALELHVFSPGDPEAEEHYPRLDWIIVGGESGAGARPFDVAWARSTVEQCAAAGVACFVKQLGAHVLTRNDDNFTIEQDPPEPDDWPPHFVEEDRIEQHPRDVYQGAPVRVRLRDPKGGDMSEWPSRLQVRQFPAVRP